MGKKIGILQSNYIPWKGYFDLINMVDEFILFDVVQYTKNDWRNRNRIKTAQGVQWLTIPVLRESLSQKINETRVKHDLWRKKHWRAISQAYAKAKYFKEHRDLFESLYLDSEEQMLSKINIAFLTAINGILGITTDITNSSVYDLSSERTERLINICRQTGADEYVSGPAAKDYINREAFKQAGITLTWMDYERYPEYEQLYPPFDHHVSIIDLLMNTGNIFFKYMKSFS